MTTLTCIAKFGRDLAVNQLPPAPTGQTYPSVPWGNSQNAPSYPAIALNVGVLKKGDQLDVGALCEFTNDVYIQSGAQKHSQQVWCGVHLTLAATQNATTGGETITPPSGAGISAEPGGNHHMAFPIPVQSYKVQDDYPNGAWVVYVFSPSADTVPPYARLLCNQPSNYLGASVWRMV